MLKNFKLLTTFLGAALTFVSFQSIGMELDDNVKSLKRKVTDAALDDPSLGPEKAEGGG